MSFEITDNVPAFSDEDVAALVAEAEDGYDLAGRSPERNPHFQRLQLVPADLLDAIDERAQKDAQSPEAVVRQAPREVPGHRLKESTVLTISHSAREARSVPTPRLVHQLGCRRRSEAKRHGAGSVVAWAS